MKLGDSELHVFEFGTRKWDGLLFGPLPVRLITGGAGHRYGLFQSVDFLFDSTSEFLLKTVVIQCEGFKIETVQRV